MLVVGRAPGSEHAAHVRKDAPQLRPGLLLLALWPEERRELFAPVGPTLGGEVVKKGESLPGTKRERLAVPVCLGRPEKSQSQLTALHKRLPRNRLGDGAAVSARKPLAGASAPKCRRVNPLLSCSSGDAPGQWRNRTKSLRLANAYHALTTFLPRPTTRLVVIGDDAPPR